MVVQTWIVIIFGIFFMNLQYFTLYRIEMFFIILLATQGSCALKSIVNISPPNNFDPATPLVFLIDILGFKGGVDVTVSMVVMVVVYGNKA